MNARNALQALLAAGALSLALTPGAQAAKPVHVSCGEVIIADTKLGNDLIDCPNQGIVIGAPNVRLDLNGHTVDGDDAEVENCPEVGPCDVGIANSAIEGGQVVNGPGFRGVTIENGTVRQFGVGVYVVGVGANRLSDLTASDNFFHGLMLTRGANANRVDGNRVSDNLFDGIVISRSDDNRIEDNSASGNGGAGVLVFAGSGNRIQRNAASDNADGVGLAFGSDGNLVKGNAASANGAGVFVEASSDNLVTLNSLRHNRFLGVVLVGADRNRIETNSVVSNGTEEPEGGIHLFEGGDGNVILKNTLWANSGDGIAIEESATGTSIERNDASENTDDGIDVDTPSTTLTSNTANRNRDLGIEAVPGVTDGGGNKAGGNGNPLQCTNVFCK